MVHAYDLLRIHMSTKFFFPVKEKMLQFEDLQEKYHYEYNVKEEEVS